MSDKRYNISSFEDFKNLAKEDGFTTEKCTEHHWKLKGINNEVNVYPFSKKKTVYVSGNNINGTTNYVTTKTCVKAAFEIAALSYEVRSGNDIKKRKNLSKKKKMLYATNKLCHWCKMEMSYKEATVEHLVPLSKGGTNDIKNLRLAHQSCNQDRGNKMPTDEQAIKASLEDQEEAVAKMRVCEFIIRKNEGPNGASIEVNCMGVFHKWGSSRVTSDNGNVQWTVAVVEDDEGQVYLINPKKIKFMDRDKK